MLSFQVSTDEEQNPLTFKSIFRSWKLTQTLYIPSSSWLWLTPSKTGIDGMWNSCRFRRARMTVSRKNERMREEGIAARDKLETFFAASFN
jgi:hypothetical protein